MKILKPGKVEQRKFECDCCGCVFVASYGEVPWGDQEVECPQEGCDAYIGWEFGEPYEEPTPTEEDVIERLADLICNGCTTDGETAWETARFLVENGVTFREG